jgi:hypothetical protein
MKEASKRRTKPQEDKGTQYRKEVGKRGTKINRSTKEYYRQVEASKRKTAEVTEEV